LVVDDLTWCSPLHQSEVKAVSDLNFTLNRETLAVVGERSGKSQASAIMGLLAKNGRATKTGDAGRGQSHRHAPAKLDGIAAARSR
jgi:oligopeptide transport system ATP-binding protein